ncbi:MAG: phosphate ABC transporter permease PstA [Gemmatimonadota bacterium]|nr:phosphate ABC transporter permease PstA [Gemmatimonadota bacterium]MDH4351970.1 phosphate ABC transporter permease PstA [Gemmatimonadota bacterium]MDH5197681.1 phosphate ABC transporter permease PstA [Gemmatimonadota bacterium]
MSRTARRRALSHAMTGLTMLAALLALLPLFAIFADLVIKGASSINWAFFVEIPPAAGATGGGVANAIVGTLLVVGWGSLIGLPVGIGAGVYLAEYPQTAFARVVRFLADVLNGTPSVIAGIFVWTWVVRPMGHFSGFSGGLSLAVLMLPMVARTTEEMVRLVPHSLREAALALGYPRWRTTLQVMVRTAWPGILTGGLVAVARIAGETAPLLFTALGNLNFKTDLMQPMQTLSLQIYVFATSPFEAWHRLAWGAALVLMAMVLTIGLAARYVTRSRFTRG